MQNYPAAFYETLHVSSITSAREIVPLVLRLVQPRRVIDVGCGTGEWLRVFMECGVAEVLGIDGEWVEASALQIPPARFKQHDLHAPLQIDDTFDLVVSLETAEHLPEAVAATFIESLTKLGPVVLFSGAIPFQGGAGHINEQWPDYWAAQFRRHGYVAIDCLRKQVWNNPNVAWWYAQNLLLFVDKSFIQGARLMQEYGQDVSAQPLALVHPQAYLGKVKQTRLRHAIKAKCSAIKAAVKSFAAR
jgi:SAM-dependent methyltransferase